LSAIHIFAKNIFEISSYCYYNKPYMQLPLTTNFDNIRSNWYLLQLVFMYLCNLYICS